MRDSVRGNLVVIGGAEDKEGECVILREVVRLATRAGDRMAVLTAAAENPHTVGEQYRAVFSRLGIEKVDVINIACRQEAMNTAIADRLTGVGGIFFSGGDQLRITSLLGGTALDEVLHRCYESGVVIAGTSAGASAMSDTMIVGGPGEDAPKRCTTKMAPGMGLLEEVVIDQHFAQRGRTGRLLSALAQNPYVLGIGIDEDTAIVVNPEGRFRVIGSNTVTVIDGRAILHTNASESQPDEALALTNVILHILPAGYGYDLRKRQPLLPDDWKGKENE